MIITKEMGTVMPDTTMRSPVYIDVRKAPFELYNFAEDFRRVPAAVAEATSEKRAFGFYLDGRVSAVFGTHTHVQTADEQILPNGTGYY